MQQVKIFLPNYKFFEKYGFIGGHIEHVKGTVDGFLANGFEVHLVASDDMMQVSDDFSDHNQSIFFNPVTTYFGRLVYVLLFSSRLFKQVLRRDEALIYLRYSASFLPILLVALFFQKLMPAKSSIVLEVNSFASNYYKFFSAFDRLLKHFQINIIFVSEHLRKTWDDLAGEGSKPTIHIISNGIASQKIQSAGTGLAKFKSITYLGVLKPKYGIEELCESFRCLPKSIDLELNIVGDGPMRQILEERFGMEYNINFIGPLVGKALLNFVGNNNTVMLYPSVGTFKFQSPVKLYDYLAFAKPIISADEENAREILGGYDSCVLCAINDPKSLNDAIHELRGKGAGLDDAVQIAQKHALEFHGWEKRITTLLERL